MMSDLLPEQFSSAMVGLHDKVFFMAGLVRYIEEHPEGKIQVTDPVLKDALSASAGGVVEAFRELDGVVKDIIADLEIYSASLSHNAAEVA